ncbi:chemotaxis protein [Paenibacillaceae bacterium]|nr:chemotaxis protein [Paenibacillaceae bacterium]
MNQGLIVFLNGTSSSGKTSISTELLNQNEIPFHHLSIDNFFKGFFHDYIDFINTTCPDDVPVSTDIIIDPLVTIFFSTVKYMSAKGMNVVVDTVNDSDERFNTCLNLLNGHPVLFVGVTCSKEELVRREERRGDRDIGLASSQFDKVYGLHEYDIEVNTETLRPVECANFILNFIRSDGEYSAFKKLNKRSFGVS